MHTFLTKIVLVAVCVTSLLFAACSSSQAAEDDIKLIGGTWTIEVVITNGDKVEFDDLKKFALISGAAGSWVLQYSGQEVAHGTNTYDQTKSPKEIDFTAIDGEGKETKYVGIYAMEENVRVICYTEAGKPRPTEFDSTLDNECALITFARVKKE